MSGERRDGWKDRAPSELIDQLVDWEEYVTFTDAWRALSAEEQIGMARAWLGNALGLNG